MPVARSTASTLTPTLPVTRHAAPGCPPACLRVVPLAPFAQHLPVSNGDKPGALLRGVDPTWKRAQSDIYLRGFSVPPQPAMACPCLAMQVQPGWCMLAHQ